MYIAENSFQKVKTTVQELKTNREENGSQVKGGTGMGLNREELRKSAREWVKESMRTGKDAEGLARSMQSIVHRISWVRDDQLHQGVETIMGTKLSKEQTFFWMEEIAGYLLALAEIIQDRQKDRG